MASHRVEFVNSSGSDEPGHRDKPRVNLPPELRTVQRKILAEKFLEACGGEKECQLTRKMLHDFAGVQTKYHNDRLFTLIKDHNRKNNPRHNPNTDSITYSEFLAFVQNYCTGDESSKTKLLFDIYDSNGDGRLDKKELHQMLKASLMENKFEMDDVLLGDLATTLLEEGLGEGDGNREDATLGLEEFRKLFQGHKHLIENVSTVIEKWLQPIPEKKKRSGPGSQRCKSMWHYLQKNSTYAFWVAAFYSLNVALFIVRILIFFGDIHMRTPDYWALAVARGFGWCLNFSSSFILFTMMRQLLTALRPTAFFKILPIDDHKELHRIVGKWIVFAGASHMVAHLVNVKFQMGRLGEDKKWNYFSYMYSLEATPTLGLLPGFAYLSGFILVFILLVMFFFTFSFVRRNGYFHAFYISHIVGYPLFYILLVLHCQNFWKWFIGPGIIFAIEQVLRTYYNWIGFSTTVKMGVILPSKVTNLVINRPPGFNFSPGDYMFIKIPYLSRFEWHAFTISSAPENWDELSLHIRAVGPWTENLYKFFTYMKNLDIQVQFPNGKPSTHDPRLQSSRGKRQTIQSVLRKNIIARNLGIQENKVGSMIDDSRRERGLSTFPSPNMATLPRNFTVMTASTYNHQVIRPDTVVLANDTQVEAPHQSKQGKNRRMLSTAPNIHINHNPEPSTSAKANRMGSELQPLVEPTPEPQLPDQYTQILGKPLKVYIDGPYGAPASEIFRAEHAVLIGAGIGVTPFASILQSIMYRHWETMLTCPKCTYKFSHGFQSQLNRLKKVDFFWTNPEQNAFTWFISLLSKLEIEQDELGGEMDRFLDIHMYMTKALQHNDMKAVALQLVLDLFYQKNKRDCLTKLKARMNAGRPAWDKVFKKIKDQNHGAVSVFFCGPKLMGNQIDQLCTKYGFTFRTETF